MVRLSMSERFKLGLFLSMSDSQIAAIGDVRRPRFWEFWRRRAWERLVAATRAEARRMLQNDDIRRELAPLVEEVDRA